MTAIQHTVIVGAVVAFARRGRRRGRSCPARPDQSPRTKPPKGSRTLVATSARSLPEHLGRRRDLAGATLDLLAEAGFSSLTFSGIATRSGVSTNNIGRYWTVRVDAVVDAVDEVFEEHPIPDTGDIASDLARRRRRSRRDRHAAGPGPCSARSSPRPPTTPSSTPSCAAASSSRGGTSSSTASNGPVAAGQLPADTDAQWLAETITGPIWLRALVTRDPLDAEYIDHLVDDAARVMARPDV